MGRAHRDISPTSGTYHWALRDTTLVVNEATTSGFPSTMTNNGNAQTRIWLALDSDELLEAVQWVPWIEPLSNYIVRTDSQSIKEWPGITQQKI